jgi:hypothetical protein
MLRQLLVGSAVSACNIMIHALVMVAVVSVARMVGTKHTLHPWLFLIAVMVATVTDYCDEWHAAVRLVDRCDF